MPLDREIRDKMDASSADENNPCKESDLTRELKLLRESSVASAFSKYGSVTPMELYMLDREKYYDCCTPFPKP